MAFIVLVFFSVIFMLKIKLPGKKSMESSAVKSKQSSSGEEIGNMKKKSSAANVRNTGRISSIRVLYEYKPEPEKAERKKSPEVITIHDTKSHSKDHTNIKGDTKQDNEGYNTNIKGDTKQGNEELMNNIVLQRKSLSKNVGIAESQGDAKLEPIVATPSSSGATNKIKTNEVHLKTKDIVKAKNLIKAAKNNQISHATMMTRGRLKKILETEYGVSASDYLSVHSTEKHFVVHDLRKSAQRKRPKSPIKHQVKKTKK